MFAKKMQFFYFLDFVNLREPKIFLGGIPPGNPKQHFIQLPSPKLKILNGTLKLFRDHDSDISRRTILVG